MTTFLFCAVAVSGMAIVNRVPFNRRTRFIITASLALGYGATLVPNWFSYVFTYTGNSHPFRGFLDAIEFIMETGFAITALVAKILNFALPKEIEDTDTFEGKEEINSAETDEVVSKDQILAHKVYEV